MHQCFVFRTHKIDPLHQTLIREYAKDLSDYADMVVNLNINSKEPRPQMLLQYWKTFCDQEKIKLTIFVDNELKKRYPFYQGGWLHSQYSFTETYRQLQGYDYYWFVEYDVRISGSIKEILQHHEKNQADILATHIASYSKCKDWYWWKERCKIDVPINLRWKFFVALSRYSSRLLQKLEQAVKTQYAVVESLVSTVCVQHFGPSSLQELDRRFWMEPYGPTIRWQPNFWNAHHYQQVVKPTLKKNMVYHPVK